MNTQSPENTESGRGESEVSVSPVEERSARNSGAGSALSGVGFVQLALVVLTGIFLWQWLEGHRAIDDMRQQLARKIAEIDGASKAGKSLLTQSQDQVSELSARIALLEARFAETQNQRDALQTLYADMSAGRDEFVLAEIEQMLLIATQQLQLSPDTRVAMIALQNADARLLRTNRNAFSELRNIINQDIGRLRALPRVDISAASAQLDKLMAAVDELPLSYRQRVAAKGETQAAAPDGETTWQRLLREIGQEARQLVRIENTGKEEIPLLPPSQEFFLRENFRLRLMSARLALVSRNEEAFRRDLNAAQLWTTRYFDDKSNEGVRMLSGLKNLAAADIRIDVPDISRSLQAVSNFRLVHEGEPKAGFGHRAGTPQ